jgi:hypothetical protein
MIGIGIGLPFLMRSSVGFAPVSIPAGFLVTPPFEIQQNGTQYRVDPDFDLETYANISVTKTYYVDSVGGSDSNTGLSWGQAFKTLTKIQSQGDCDLCNIKSGSYFFKNQRPGSFARSMKIIAEEGGAYITSDVTNQAGTWTNTTNYWQSVFGDFPSIALDWTNLDSNGNPIQLTAVASIALVNSTPNSIYVAYPNVYVRTFDSRRPDSNLKFYDSTSLSPTRDNIKYYYENIKFLRGFSLNNNSSTGGLKCYFKNCEIASFVAMGVSEMILQNCTSWVATGDCFNYDLRNTIPTIAYEIDCDLQNRATAGNDQASTTHNGCTIVRVGGAYHDISGQCCADVVGGQTWMLGCELYNSRVSNTGYYADTSQTWLDGVYIHDVNTGINCETGTTVYFRNLRNLATTPTTGGGTFTAY